MILRFDSIKTILLEKLIEYLNRNFLVLHLLSQIMDIHILSGGRLLYAFFKFEELHHLDLESFLRKLSRLGFSCLDAHGPSGKPLEEIFKIYERNHGKTPRVQSLVLNVLKLVTLESKELKETFNIQKLVQLIYDIIV